MGYRVAFGALALLVLYLLFWLDVAIAQSCVDLQGPLGNLLRRGSILPVLFVVILLCSAVELDRMLRTKGAIPHTRFAFLMITLLILTPWFCAAGWLGSGLNQDEEFYWMAIWLVMTVMGAALLTVIRQQPGGTIRDVGATLSMIFYIGFMGSFITLLRCGQDLPTEKGAWLLLMVVMVTKASDISAYFVGSTLGRHKLVPRISPGKTVEGTLGGMAGSAILATFFASISSDLFYPTAFSGNTSLLVEQPLTSGFTDTSGMSPVMRACIFGITISITGQIGDLFESCFKRDAGSKDSGKIIPRYGGILDLVDSPVLAVPVAWFLLTVVWGIV